MNTFKLLGITALLTTAITANANVGKYLSINPMSPVDVPISEAMSEGLNNLNENVSELDELEKIDRENLLNKIKESPSVQLSEEERALLEKINAETEVRSIKEKNAAHVVLLVSLAGIFFAGASVGTGVLLDSRKKKKLAGNKI